MRPQRLLYAVWCECQHISGQHGTHTPHRCTVCDCQAFKSPALEALTKFLDLRTQINSLEHDCDPPEFTRCDLCERQLELESHQNRLVDLWAETWAIILHEQLVRL